VSRPGDPVRVGDDVGGGQEPGRWGRLEEIRYQDGKPVLYLIRKYVDGDKDGEPTGEYRQSPFIWPTEW
jgi:hypothetical protein